MNINKKLMISFMCVTIISMMSGVIGFFLLKRTNVDYTAALENYGFSQGKIGKLGMEINAARAYTRDIVFLTEKTQLDEAYKNFRACTDMVDILMEQIEPTNISKESQNLFAQIESNLKEYRVVRDQVITLAIDNTDNALAYKIWINEASPIVNKIAEEIEQLLDINTKAGTALSNKLSGVGFISGVAIIAIIITGFISSIIISVYISKKISTPIIKMSNAVQRLSEGNLDVTVDYVSGDEIGIFAKSFSDTVSTWKLYIADISRGLYEISDGNFDISATQEFKGDFKVIKQSIDKIIISLSDTLSQINMASEQVSSGAEQISSVAQSLSQGATEQAISVEELSKSISEVSEQVNKSADNSLKATQISIEVSKEVEQGNNQMQYMVKAMSDISIATNEISKIIKTVEDIASQTNLLALNASIEAARAGEAGNGFVVVANEVRNLANKSTEAAKNTNLLIESVIATVNNGKNTVDETAKSLNSIVKSTEHSTVLIDEISRASSGQASAILQIRQGVEQISGVIQNNSATSQQSAASSEELSSQAQMLKSLVSSFKLKTI